MGRGLTFLQGCLRGRLFVWLSSAPRLPFALLCPFSPAACPKTGSQAVVCKRWHSPLRLEPRLHQKLFELSEFFFSPFHLTPFLYLWTRRIYDWGAKAAEDKLVCLALLHLQIDFFSCCTFLMMIYLIFPCFDTKKGDLGPGVSFSKLGRYSGSLKGTDDTPDPNGGFSSETLPTPWKPFTVQNITVNRRLICTDELIRTLADYIGPKVRNLAGINSAGVLADDRAASTFAGGLF